MASASSKKNPGVLDHIGKIFGGDKKKKSKFATKMFGTWCSEFDTVPLSINFSVSMGDMGDIVGRVTRKIYGDNKK